MLFKYKYLPETESLAILVEIRLYKYQCRNIIINIMISILKIFPGSICPVARPLGLGVSVLSEVVSSTY